MITGAQVRQARKLLGWPAIKLALKSRRSLLRASYARRTMAERHLPVATLKAIRNALEAAGVDFRHGGEPGMRAKGNDT